MEFLDGITLKHRIAALSTFIRLTIEHSFFSTGGAILVRQKNDSKLIALYCECYVPCDTKLIPDPGVPVSPAATIERSRAH